MPCCRRALAHACVCVVQSRGPPFTCIPCLSHHRRQLQAAWHLGMLLLHVWVLFLCESGIVLVLVLSS